MKTLNIYAALLFSIFALNFSFAQTALKKETIKVWGNCGMCKKTIERSARSAGATHASWNEETKILNVTYNSRGSNPEKIQKAIAASGYDTQEFKADDKAYNNLHGCCKYERNTAFAGVNVKTNSADCKEMACCKDNGCCDKDGKCDGKACKEVAACKENNCCKS